MAVKFEHIEFEITDDSKFDDLKKIYALIAEAKLADEIKPHEHWLTIFPEYSVKHFYFRSNRLKPAFGTAEKTDNTWPFEGIIDHLIEDMDVEYLECTRDGNKGRIVFDAWGYPYGGVGGLIVFLNSFGCKATVADEGGYLFKIKWESENTFSYIEIPHSNRTN